MPAAPSVTVVIPTLNSSRYLAECLASIREQEYAGAVDVVLVDAGSTDDTVRIAREHGVETILPNPLRTGEAGKAVGLRAARGELVLSVDSDNVLVGSDWLSRMVEPFGDAAVVAAQPVRWDYRRSDHFVVRWASLAGVTDPLSLYAGTYDRYSYVTGRWTDCAHESERRDGWLRVVLDPTDVPTMGANGYIVRREALALVPLGDYFFDVDFVHDLVERGQRTMALVDVPIRHYFCDSVTRFRAKTRRRIDDYLYFSSVGAGRSYPWTTRRARGIARFALSSVLVVPLLVDAARGARRQPDAAWLFHPPACWIALAVYAGGTVRGLIRPRMMSRSGWRQ